VKLTIITRQSDEVCVHSSAFELIPSNDIRLFIYIDYIQVGKNIPITHIFAAPPKTTQLMA